MNIRETLNNNPAIMTIGAVVVLVLCLGAIMCQLRGPSGVGGPVDLYFLDEKSGQLFTASSNMQPPIASPSDSGGELSGVRAHVFGCGECPKRLTGLTVEEVESRGAFVAYLEKYTPEAKAAMERAMSATDPEIEMMYELDQGRLIRMVGTQRWIDANSEEGVNVYTVIRDRCPEDQRPRQCFPGR